MECSHPSLLFLHSFLLLFLSLSQAFNHDFPDCMPVPDAYGALTASLSYPFLVHGRPDYCGHPSSFLSDIHNSSLMISINNGYQVKNVDYSKYLLNIIDTGFLGQTSPQTFHNTIINNSHFDYGDSNQNLALNSNCMLLLDDPALYCIRSLRRAFGQHSGLDNMNFSKCSATLSYLSLDISTPTMQSDELVAVELAGNVNHTAALHEGFSVKWKPESDWCRSCMSSGGHCDYHPDKPGDQVCLYRHFGTIDRCITEKGDAIITREGERMRKEIGITYYRRRTLSGNFRTSSSNIVSHNKMKNRTAKHIQHSPRRDYKHNDQWKWIAIGALGFGGLILVCFLVFLLQCHRRKLHNSIFCKQKTDSFRAIEDFLENHGTLAPKSYTYSEVKTITRTFRNKLGQGGYGVVFHGTLSDGHEVAVKVLSESKGNGEEFINEVASIGRTSHVNVVSLLGFCLEGRKRALIYDFMLNGSLDKYIYRKNLNPARPLGWETLYKIAVGIARGLEYLHRGCNTRIVHFDIKPHNILLDANFCPKISDFGLAKLCPHKDSRVSMVGARGTIGYIAPEVFSRSFGAVSSKSDVYSYGMMVLEMVGGQRNNNATTEKTSEFFFPEWIYEHMDRDGALHKWGVTIETEEIARKMILVGLWCIQTMPTNRPLIGRVVEMLRGSVNDIEMPPKPCISSPVRSIIESPTMSTS